MQVDAELQTFHELIDVVVVANKSVDTFVTYTSECTSTPTKDSRKIVRCFLFNIERM